MALSDVDDYLKGHRYKKSVYLITGLKVAKGVTVKVEKSSNIEGRISAGINPSGGVVKVGPKAEGKSEDKPVYAFTESSDIVVGIQCLRLFHRKTGWFGRDAVKSEYVTTGATFHGEDGNKPEETPANFIAVRPEDYKIPGLISYMAEDETWMVKESDFQAS